MQKQIEREMTIEEIEAEFDGQWVLIGDPELNQYLEVVRGRVLCHSADHDAFNRASLEFEDSSIKSLASFYVGDTPEGARIII